MTCKKCKGKFWQLVWVRCPNFGKWPCYLCQMPEKVAHQCNENGKIRVKCDCRGKNK